MAAVSRINYVDGGRLQGLSQGKVSWTREGGENGEKIFLRLNVQYERNQETLSKFLAWTTRTKKLPFTGMGNTEWRVSLSKKITSLTSDMAQPDMPTYPSEDAGGLFHIQVWSSRAKVKKREN